MKSLTLAFLLLSSTAAFAGDAARFGPPSENVVDATEFSVHDLVPQGTKQDRLDLEHELNANEGDDDIGEEYSHPAKPYIYCNSLGWKIEPTETGWLLDGGIVIESHELVWIFPDEPDPSLEGVAATVIEHDPYFTWRGMDYIPRQYPCSK